MECIINYSKIYSISNLTKAWKKARKGKTKKEYVKRFENRLTQNLFRLHYELISKIYSPKRLKTFIVRDPKTRKISKSDFRDRVVHHAIVNFLEPIYEKVFIYDSYANRKNKGTHNAIKRFDKFKRKVSRNGKVNGWFDNNQVKGYCLKADIKKYFQNINHKILIDILKKKIKCERTLWLIKQILNNYVGGGAKGNWHASRQFNKPILC